MSRSLKISLLGSLALVCGCALFFRYFAVTLRSDVRPEELYAVMARQLEALQADDFARAYEQTSSSMQQRLDLMQFTEVTRIDYVAIASCKRVEFGQLHSQGRHAMLQVFFIDSRDTVTPCLYSFVKEERGWRIDGTRLLRRWETGRKLSGVRA